MQGTIRDWIVSVARHMMDGVTDDEDDEFGEVESRSPEEIAMMAFRVGDVLASAGEYDVALRDFFTRSEKEYKKLDSKHRMLIKVYNSMASCQESKKECVPCSCVAAASAPPSLRALTTTLSGTLAR